MFWHRTLLEQVFDAFLLVRNQVSVSTFRPHLKKNIYIDNVDIILFHPMLENSCLENAWRAVLIAKMAFILNIIPPPPLLFTVCVLYTQGMGNKEWREVSGYTAVSSLGRVHIKWDYSGNLNTPRVLKSNVCG